MKKVRRYIATGTTGLDKHDKLAQYIILIIMNIIAFPMAAATVQVVGKGFSEVNEYVQKHKVEITQFVNEIETEVGNISDSTKKLVGKLKE